ncbi:IS110 family transposase [Pseudoduganella lutea]|uniref:IS110 family transposase n=1 Tax=Pseudoduganella lutea TaxID=321985 RepID=A0A4P6KZX3_9BURK|nr:IS110 family transposase [Pseudoduganella lutea]QBE62463.1 IS110 family transposase [Pseudoduganella lutea]QBE63122.1 IS110 family transposase [Pseudoduganella lutea]QBE64375.1 IS110 family transposase [Pseudoduganella lutea]
MKITVCGVDLAKEVFQFHGVNAAGKVEKRIQLRRGKVMEFFANMAPCLIGMEACGSAHYWARQLQSLGHTVKLIAPQFVKPYVKTNKHDAADAEAICEAVQRPSMRFVPIKNIEQQAILAVHTARAGFVKQRTAQANQIRGLLAEFGLIVPKGLALLKERVPTLLDEAKDELPGAFRQTILELLDHLNVLDKRVKQFELEIQNWHRSNSMSQRLEKIPGIGPITASALVAAIGNAKHFANGRQLAAWLGLVPKQHSTGGRTNLLGISKRGDTYLRTLLIHGARAVIRHAANKIKQDWLHSLLSRRHKNIAAVALANKNARTVWALLAHDREFRVDYAAA